MYLISGGRGGQGWGGLYTWGGGDLTLKPLWVSSRRVITTLAAPEPCAPPAMRHACELVGAVDILGISTFRVQDSGFRV